jgi:hypothetical protein
MMKTLTLVWILIGKTERNPDYGTFADDPLGNTLASHNPVFSITSVLPMSRRESASPVRTDE